MISSGTSKQDRPHSSLHEAEAFQYEALFGLSLVIVLPIVGFGTWWCLKVASDLILAPPQDARFFLAPRGVTWVIPALFLSFGESLLVLRLIGRALLGASDADLVERAQFRLGRARRRSVYAGIYLGLCAGMMFLFCDWRVCFCEHRIVINKLFALRQQVYDYRDVRDIVTAPAFVAPDGRLVQRRLFAIRFADGISWNTNLEPSGASPERLREIIDYVSARSGIAVREEGQLPGPYEGLH